MEYTGDPDNLKSKSPSYIEGVSDGIIEHWTSEQLSKSIWEKLL